MAGTGNSNLDQVGTKLLKIITTGKYRQKFRILLNPKNGY
jgi:hypothetical protein